MCDIERIFHQFSVNPDDRDYLRFLWWKQDINTIPEVYRIKVHLFGAASSPGCENYALKKIAVDNTDAFDPAVSDFVIKNFYVDDGLVSVVLLAQATWSKMHEPCVQREIAGFISLGRIAVKF